MKKPQSRLAQNHSNFPVLRKSSSLAKPLISLAKVQLDSNMGNMDHSNSKNKSREILTSFSHKRIGSGISVRQLAQSNLSKTSRNGFYQNMNEPKKIGSLLQQCNSTSNSGPNKNLKEGDRHSHSFKIDKAKISSKGIGLVKAYAVNSHPGHNSTNEDRICIVTNLNRSNYKQNQVSFFSIYDGRDGVAKAEFFRDNFHSELSKEGDLLKDLEKCIRKTYLTVEKDFQVKQPNHQTSETSINMCLLMGKTAINIEKSLHFIHTQDMKIVISRRFGQELHNPTDLTGNTPQKSSKYKYFLKSSEKFQRRAEVCIRQVPVEDLDFIILGSEGLFQNLNQKIIGKKIWHSLLKHQNDNLHFAMGEAVNSVMLDAFAQNSTKNVSIIMIGFESIAECMRKDDDIQLPHVERVEPLTEEL